MNDADAAAVLEALQPPEPEQPIEVLKPETEKKAEIQIVDGQMQFTSIDQVWRLADAISQSGLAPDSFRNKQQIFIVLLRAMELKIGPFQALEGMMVIRGKIGMTVDLALAMVQASGRLKECSTIHEGEGDEFKAVVTLQRKGRKANTYSFSVAQAKRAMLWGKPGPWTQYSERMLRYRALGFGLRDEFPDILRGIKTAEELQDYPEPNHKS